MERQHKDHASNAIVLFINAAMSPAFYTDKRGKFLWLQTALNEKLCLAGLRVTDEGKLGYAPKAATLDEVAMLVGRMKTSMTSRGAHPEIVCYCEREVLERDPFLEAYAKLSLKK